jgi:hypothetical protein
LGGANLSNTLATAADLNETSIEQALIDIAGFTDERGLKIAVRGMKLIIPKELVFTAERIMKSTNRVATADNDINAIKNMGMIPQGYTVNNFLTDTDAWFIKTDAPNGMKMFNRVSMVTSATRLVSVILSGIPIPGECTALPELNVGKGREAKSLPFLCK